MLCNTMIVKMLVIRTPPCNRHGTVVVEACGARTEPENYLMVNLIVESKIGFLVEFFRYSIEIILFYTVANSCIGITSHWFMALTTNQSCTVYRYPG